MKLEARRVEGFLDAPGECRAVLLYGEDTGLIRERAGRLVRAVIGAADDPFRLAELDRDTAARIPEEMASLSLMGGRRAIRVRDAGDGMVAVVQRALDGGGEALLVLEGPGLAARSKLRALLEKAKDGVAIGCYPLDGGALEQMIARSLSDAGIGLDAPAKSWLAEHLGTDVAVTRRELEKLALYVGPGGRVDVEAAQACVGDLAGLSLDDALFAATEGDLPEADRALELAIAEGAAPVGVLRALLLHLQRLQRARGAMTEGIGASEAVKLVRPPVFYKKEASFLRAMGLWTDEALESAGQRVWEAEQQCKRTGSPAETICRRIVLTIAQRSAALRRR
jgi:DNA polymerase-3 subunit delta